MNELLSDYINKNRERELPYLTECFRQTGAPGNDSERNLQVTTYKPNIRQHTRLGGGGQDFFVALEWKPERLEDQESGKEVW